MNFEDKSSLRLLRKVNNRIKERQFHEQTHVLYDLADKVESGNVVYCEIGSYVGSSASLMLENKSVDKVICIDPLSLPLSHYRGSKDQEQTLRENLSVYESNRYKIFKNYSGEPVVLNYFRENNINIDILFIDGDHSKRGVFEDFSNYKDFVKSGGFLVFDDYLDNQYSPEVRLAVDEIIAREQVKKEFEILGLPKGPALDRDYGTFIMRKI